MSQVHNGEFEGGWVIEIRCTECDETEKFTVMGWAGPERVYAAVCAECAEKIPQPLSMVR
jgi:hypothetical protein